MTSFSKPLGIIGGAGPTARVFLYTSILEICQKQYNAHGYNEFPEVVLVSYPFTRGNGEKIRREIALCLSKLKAAGAVLFCIASNSFHGFLPELPNVGFVNLVTEGLKEATHQRLSKALVLFSRREILPGAVCFKCLYNILWVLNPKKVSPIFDRLDRDMIAMKLFCLYE
jgi:aspartate/glutamate racemase